MNQTTIEVVTIGGGTGQNAVLQALRKLHLRYRLSITSVTATWDSGGSTGLLRTAHGIIAPGDIGQSIHGLAPEPENIEWLLSCRFSGNGDLRGHTARNAIVVAAFEWFGLNQGAMDAIKKAFHLIGDVAPVTWDQTNLHAELKDGTQLHSEDAINRHDLVLSGGIKRLWLDPSPKANPAALAAIKNADIIMFTPGTPACSLKPNALVEGMLEALRESGAGKVCITNLMNRHGHVPPDWTVRNHVEDLEGLLGAGFFNIIVQNGQKLHEDQRNFYAREKMVLQPATWDPHERMVITEDLVMDLSRAPKKSETDVIADLRASVRHDPEKLSRALARVFNAYTLGSQYHLRSGTNPRPRVVIAQDPKNRSLS